LSRTDTLKSLEIVLESFLDRAVGLKENRLAVLDGINRLDDIAQGFSHGQDLTDKIGGWFAEHNRWLEEPVLRQGDQRRIGDILESIKNELGTRLEPTPAGTKIVHEIDRWEETRIGKKLVLKRAPEPTPTTEKDTITLFANMLTSMSELFSEMSTGKAHIMSVLDDALNSATIQKNREALLLSAFIIYYLKQNHYMVEPFIKRLKEAQNLQQEGGHHA
jgi:hypothetical protein